MGRKLWVDGFAMQRFPVTNREYIEFLDALVAEGKEELALRHAPRERPAVEERLGSLLYARTPSGGFAVTVAVAGSPRLRGGSRDPGSQCLRERIPRKYAQLRMQAGSTYADVPP